MNEELRFHIEQQIAENIAAGMRPQEARRQATLQFGGAEGVKEDCREQRRGFWLESFWADLRYGVRILRRSPGFTIIAVLTLALGIGANTAIFSVVNAVLLKSLPFRDPGRLVMIFETHPSIPEIGAPMADVQDWAAESHSFSSLAMYSDRGYAPATMMFRGKPETIQGEMVSQNLFPLLGIVPALGRNFLPEEDRPGHGSVAILSGEIWKSRFGADPNVLGQTVALNGKSYSIVGVLPPGQRFPQDAGVWVPIANLDQNDRTSRYYHAISAIGRLHAGVTARQANAELGAIAARLARAYPDTNQNIGAKVVPMQDEYVGGLGRALMIVWGAVALVLFIACANVASMLLARSANRQSEMAVRSALGASRARLIRQGLTESILLGGIGGLCGLALAWASLPLFSSWLPRVLDAPILAVHEIRIDFRVLIATLAIGIGVGIVFGLLPALRLGGGQAAGLQARAEVSASGRHRRAHYLLVGVEVALAVVILISAGLFARSLEALFATPPGFRTDHLLTMRISLLPSKYNSDQALRGFFDRLLPKIRALPGVEGTATIDQTPLVPNTGLTRFLVDGAPPVSPGDYPVAHYRVVSPDYFKVMGIPLVEGRTLEEADVTRPDPGVVVINRTLAREFFPGQNPIDRKLDLGVATGQLTKTPVAGVVGDVRDLSISSPAPPEMYFAGFAPVSVLVVRTAIDPSSLVRAIRNVVFEVDPTQPVFEVRTGVELLDASMARQRFSSVIFSVFSFLAIVLAAGGVYGVTAYAVAERTREIGLRMALGAQPGDVLRLVLRQEMLAAMIGLVVGIAGGFAVTKLLTALLYGVSPSDPTAYLGASVLLGGAIALASYIPARRAMRVDPMVALRYE